MATNTATNTGTGNVFGDILSGGLNAFQTFLGFKLASQDARLTQTGGTFPTNVNDPPPPDQRSFAERNSTAIIVGVTALAAVGALLLIAKK